ncbi:hypothetical protein ACFYXC_36615 [Streptomyces sp. NPDC002701]|uniref:hypothetical protein n=1 Tax=Streptomyces sp. NPDC002701 TaxID=3364661 RepID=UPI003678186C
MGAVAGRVSPELARLPGGAAERTTLTDQTSSNDGPEPSGIDLARVALQQARLAARNNGLEARAQRRRQAAATEAAALRRARQERATRESGTPTSLSESAELRTTA